MCPMCGGPLYLENSTGDAVCPACCKMKHGDRYTLLSLIRNSEEDTK